MHYVGKSKDELLINKGAPDFKEQLSNGDILWTYRNSKTGKYRGVTISTGDAPARRSIVRTV